MADPNLSVWSLLVVMSLVVDGRGWCAKHFRTDTMTIASIIDVISVLG